MKHTRFNKTRLAASVSLILGTAVAVPVFAEEASQIAPAKVAETEIIEVRGIRGSLVRAMDIKRESRGVVDAISSEEMGKFPDTNLAESLQRITGVAVSRSNGEGSQITVRGFGPDFNLITLNGRQMPGTGKNRSYNLENLSSEGISTLEVYKTARAELPTGGLGATVNIITTRPLASPGLKYSVSGKGLLDGSNEEGDDITPELSALYSNTFADETFGVALSVAYQERDWQEQNANISGWRANQDLNKGPATGTNAIDNRADCQTADGGTEKCGDTFIPRNFGSKIRDAQRSRSNAQLTLQYAPTNDFIATLDYTTSETEMAEESMGFGIWFNGEAAINAYELDENGTAVKFDEANGDYAHTAAQSTTLVEADSIGLNLDWQATDTLHFSLDYHDSSNKSDNGADKGSHSSPFLIMGSNQLVHKTYDFTGGFQIPQMALFWPDGESEARPNDFDFLFGEFGREAGESTVEQLQFDGEWENDGDGALVNIKFGAAYTEQNIGGYKANGGQQGPGTWAGNQQIYPDSLFVRQDTSGFLDEFSGGGSDLATNYYYGYDFNEVLTRSLAFFDFMDTDPLNNGKDSFGTVEEATTSAYTQAAFQLELGEMAVNINLGVRYEQTDVTSNVEQKVEQSIVWTGGDEVSIIFSEDANSQLETLGDYNLFLPSFDMDIEIVEDVVARLSLGKTIARAPLTNLFGSRTLNERLKLDNRTGSAGNTNLKPFSSVNLDLSLEYYYAEGSYVSLGYFRKEVDNFVTTSSESISVDALRDPFRGPRALQALAQLEAEGIQAGPGAIFDRVVENGGGVANPVSGSIEVHQNSDDPVIAWRVDQPVNGEEKTVHGVEFAVQHLFGESGFGASMNATFVSGDVEFDPSDMTTQSPLAGLGDSANLQLFYEKEGLSAKLTYNWRDEYLVGIGQDAGTGDNPPQFAKEFATLDASINYDVTEHFTVFVEGVNLTNETEEIFGRYREQFLRASQYGSRYAVGARYSF